MNKRNGRWDFFDDMANYRERSFNRLNVLLISIEIPLSLLGVIILSIFLNDKVAQQWLIVVIVLMSLASIISIIILAFIIQKNNDDFMAGKFSSGMANLILFFIFSITIVVILVVVLPEKWQSVIPAVITAVVAIFGAVLAIMGVHYTEIKKCEVRRYNNKLIFSIDKNSDNTVEYKLEPETNRKRISVRLRNNSDNYGVFCGVYGISERGVSQIGSDFNHAVIVPKTSYVIKNISYRDVDDRFILVYKDIEDVHYYLHCRVLSSRTVEIIKSDICDMNYIHMKIKKATHKESAAECSATTEQ